MIIISGSVAQWITRLTTNQEIAGSTPARVENFSCTMFVYDKWKWNPTIAYVFIDLTNIRNHNVSLDVFYQFLEMCFNFWVYDFMVVFLILVITICDTSSNIFEILTIDSFDSVIYWKRVILILLGVFSDQQKKFERFCVFEKYILV